VAPSQYELAPIFTTANVGSDHNQLVMETLHKVARRHGFECLLHEKPFAGVNGSGKHVNWSMSTDDGINLLDPGKTPHENMVFLVVLGAVLKAVDKYAALLRATVATAGNDHRLGAHEAPPAIVSAFLGEQLTDILEQLAAGGAKSSKKGGEIKLGVSTLPSLPKDSTDRNRTSSFAFTGNKFEFRMCGSSQSVSGPAFVLNTIVAEVFSEIADKLESSKDVQAEAQKILHRIAHEHGRIMYNGDNYTDQWVKEAKKRGLPNLRSTVEALSHIMDEPNVKVFEKHAVLSREELQARTEILMETYSLAVNIEALTMVSMAKRQIVPAVEQYAKSLADTVEALSEAKASAKTPKAKLQKVCGLLDDLGERIADLEKAITGAKAVGDVLNRAEAYRDSVAPAMKALRKNADELETIVDAEVWPLPTYAQMLFMR
jgi:glutamine synthetase